MRIFLHLLFPLLFVWAGAAYGQTNLDRRELEEAQAHYIEGITSFENEEYHEAIQLLSVAYIHLSDRPGVNYSLADAYLKLEDLANAEYYAQQAVRLEPQNKWYHLKLAEIHHYNDNLQGTVKELRNALNYHPDDRELLFRLGQSLTYVGKLREANTVYNRLLAVEGPEINLYLQKLHNFNELGMADSVGVTLERIRELEPNNLSTLQVLANYYLKMEDPEEAIKVLEDAIVLDKENPRLLTLFIDAHLAAERWNLLDKRLVNFFADSTLTADTKLITAKHLHRRFEENSRHSSLRQISGTVFDQLVDSEPNSEDIQELGTTFYLQLGQQKKALTTLKRFTELLPDEPDNRQLEKVEQLARQALKKDPENSSFLDTLGWIYYKRGEYEQAREYIRQALLDSSAGADVMEHMGDVLAKLERWKAARHWWNKALRDDSSRGYLKEKIDNLN